MKKWIKNKLEGYLLQLNTIDYRALQKANKDLKVAVIGGGIAGIAAASSLAEKGIKVDLYEKESFLGGKVGSWEFESNGETLRTEHGFHAFFRQYYNLLNFLEQIGAKKHLIPIDDYVILFNKNEKQGFKNVETTPGINIIDLKKYGVYGWGTLINPFSISFLSLLKYDQEKTFKKYDQLNFKEFAKKTFMPKKMQLVFNSFARAFFAEPENMSMAELIKGFHFYFLSNDKGLIYDVLDSDFQTSFINYSIDFLEKYNANIFLNTLIKELKYDNNRFLVNNIMYDYCIICTDINGTKKLIEYSEGLESYNKLSEEIGKLKNSGNYAILRLWTDSFETDKDLPFFIFTDRLKCLDSITLYHKMEKESIQWSKENNGGIFELHSYAVPEDMTENECKKVLITELYHYFPELKNMEIKHEYFQFRNDFPAFHTGLHKNRPKIKTEIPNLFFAGDWVKMDNSTMLMEAAYTSGVLAANCIMKQENIIEKQLYQVATKGLFA